MPVRCCRHQRSASERIASCEHSSTACLKKLSHDLSQSVPCCHPHSRVAMAVGLSHWHIRSTVDQIAAHTVRMSMCACRPRFTHCSVWWSVWWSRGRVEQTMGRAAGINGHHLTTSSACGSAAPQQAATNGELPVGVLAASDNRQPAL